MTENNLICRICAIMLLLACGTASQIWGQNNTSLFMTQPEAYSPQTTEMIRYDNTPVNMSTGRVELTIPVAQIKDKDFSFPISVSYNSSGFRPTDPDNYVGRNWSLNYGGVIYRSVRGIPDDIDRYFQQESLRDYTITGFMKLLNNGIFNMNTMRADMDAENNPYKYAHHIDNNISLATIPGTNNIEASPDLFYFSFGKHSGQFMINYDGTISVVGYNGGKYTVDLSEYTMLGNWNLFSARISIRTDDGYVYTFGGDNLSSLEYTALTWEKGEDAASKGSYYHPTITAWYLTRIKAPNGRELDLHYRDIDWNYHRDPKEMITICKSQEFRENHYASQYVLSGLSSFSPLHDRDFHVFRPKPNHHTFSLLKIALVDSVSTDCWGVKFHFSEKAKPIKYEELYWDSVYTNRFCGAKLDSVVTRYKDNTSFRETTAFRYDYLWGNRMFLSSLRNSKNGKYSFDYNQEDMTSSPDPMTMNIDHWKYWRGGAYNTYAIPNVQFKNVMQSMEYDITTNDRDATGEKVSATLLREITYPTGGKAVFQYEPHKYTQRIVRNADSRYIPLMENCDRLTAGGARIHSIQYYQAGEDKAVKEVRYKYGEEGYEGILQYMPFYLYARYYAQDKVNFDFYGLASNSNGITAFGYPSQHILYPSVSEYYIDPLKNTTEKNSPHKTTRFNVDPDRYHYEFIYRASTGVDNDPACYTGPYYSDLCNRNMFIPPSYDLSHARGKIQDEWFYDSENDLVYETHYEYKYQYQEDYSLCIYHVFPQMYTSCGLYTHVGKVYFGMYLLEEKWTQDATSREFHKEFYTSDDNGYLKKQIALTSTGDSLITTYDYAFGNASSPQKRLTDKNTYIKPENQTPKQIGSEHYDYHNFYMPIADAYRPLIAECHAGTTNAALEKRMHYLKYDGYGNPVETEKDGIPTIYIWGYNGQYLVAEIENATYEQVTEALDGHTPEDISNEASYSIFEEFVTGIRDKLPLAHVTNYTYAPGVGMTRSTDPSGKTVYYEYDSKGRLEKTHRTGETGDREILQLNEYHLVNE